MTDQKGKKLKHDKINYELDRCYISLRQFEGKTIMYKIADSNKRKETHSQRTAQSTFGALANKNDEDSYTDLLLAKHENVARVSRKKLLDLSKRQTQTSPAEDERDTSVRRSTANE